MTPDFILLQQMLCEDSKKARMSEYKRMRQCEVRNVIDLVAGTSHIVVYATNNVDNAALYFNIATNTFERFAECSMDGKTFSNWFKRVVFKWMELQGIQYGK